MVRTKHGLLSDEAMEVLIPLRSGHGSDVYFALVQASRPVLIPLRSGHGSDKKGRCLLPVWPSLNPFEIRAWFGPISAQPRGLSVLRLNPFEIRAWFGHIWKRMLVTHTES